MSTWILGAWHTMASSLSVLSTTLSSVLVSAFRPKALDLAIEIGDGLVTAAPDAGSARVVHPDPRDYGAPCPMKQPVDVNPLPWEVPS